MIPLAGIWRDERFPDDTEQDKLQALSDSIDDAAGYTDGDHEVVAYSAAPRGVPGSELNGGQRDLLRALLGTYFGRVPESVSPMPAYDDAALDAVHIAWAGPLEPGAPHYYRLQGPRLLVEWDNTQRGANHAHSVWRNPESTSASTCWPDTGPTITRRPHRRLDRGGYPGFGYRRTTEHGLIIEKDVAVPMQDGVSAARKPSGPGAGSIPASCRICQMVKGGDLVAEPDEFTSNSPVTPRGSPWRCGSRAS